MSAIQPQQRGSQEKKKLDQSKHSHSLFWGPHPAVLIVLRDHTPGGLRVAGIESRPVACIATIAMTPTVPHSSLLGFGGHIQGVHEAIYIDRI